MAKSPYPVGFTDYPLEDDLPFEEAPIRLCWIIGYDQNKYVQVQVVGMDGVHSIKRGYVYKSYGRLTADGPRLKSYSHDELAEALRDNCVQCNGERNGTKGNENVVDGKLMCDWCSHDYLKAQRESA